MNDVAFPKLGRRYQFQKVLGSGGAGDVFTAWDTHLERVVAVKLLRADGISADVVKDSLAEALRLATIRHPNIVSVHDMGVEDGNPFVVMEYVAGATLEERVAAGVPTLAEFHDIAKQSLEGLVAAHQAGLVHCDIKPSNIMLSSQASGAVQVKLLDFGTARFRNAPEMRVVNADGTITGSVYWISPEQLAIEPVDARSDLYSLGCTFYFLLSGHCPFTGEITDEVMEAHLSHRVVPLQTRRPDLSSPVCDWVMALINRHPGDRYQSAMEALRALQYVMQPVALERTMVLASPAAAPPVANPATTAAPARGSGRRKFFTLVGVLVAGSGLWVWFSTNRPRSQVVPPPAPPEPVAVVTQSPAVTTTTLPTTAAAPPAAPVVPAPAAVPVVVPEPPAPVVVTPPPEPAPKPRERTVRTALRARGSNTIGGKLLPLVMEAFLKHEGAPVVRSRRTAAEESTLTADFPDAPESTGVDIAAHGSATAFDGLVAGLCDIGMSSRPVKDDEAAAAAAAGLGDLRSPACEHIIGLDGIAILVHPGNPVPSLTREQVARVFTGTVTNWSEVGGPNLNIQRYARDDKSGTYDSFKAMVLGTQTLAPGTRRYEDSAQLSDDVAADPGGVGFTGLAYVRSARAVPVAEIGGTPLLPTRFTVATEDYPLSRRLFLYTPSVAKSDWTRRFIEFVQSDAGQELVSRAGFVKQSIDLQRPVPPGEAPADYIDTVREADRLSLNFRFQAGSARLDNKAIRDMNRVTELLAQPRFQGRHLVLLGFTDAVGAPQVNVRLSRERAQAVARELETRGILPAVVTGFGAVLPIAANDNATGRDRNRRVEVWIR